MKCQKCGKKEIVYAGEVVLCSECFAKYDALKKAQAKYMKELKSWR